jgi:hypothetical protein
MGQTYEKDIPVSREQLNTYWPSHHADADTRSTCSHRAGDWNPNSTRGTFLPTAPTTAPQKYTDLSPELSFDKKVAVHILHADGTRERYDMARSMFYSFIKKLPREDTLLSVSAIVMGSGGYAMPTSVEISPTPKITDLLPSLNSNEKATLIVRHMDGSEEIFLIAPDRVDLFIHILPTEDTLIQVISPRGAESKPEVIPLTPDQ